MNRRRASQRVSRDSDLDTQSFLLEMAETGLKEALKKGKFKHEDYKKLKEKFEMILTKRKSPEMAFRTRKRNFSRDLNHSKLTRNEFDSHLQTAEGSLSPSRANKQKNEKIKKFRESPGMGVLVHQKPRRNRKRFFSEEESTIGTNSFQKPFVVLRSPKKQKRVREVSQGRRLLYNNVENIDILNKKIDQFKKKNSLSTSTNFKFYKSDSKYNKCKGTSGRILGGSRSNVKRKKRISSQISPEELINIDPIVVANNAFNSDILRRMSKSKEKIRAFPRKSDAEVSKISGLSTNFNRSSFFDKSLLELRTHFIEKPKKDGV